MRDDLASSFCKSGTINCIAASIVLHRRLFIGMALLLLAVPRCSTLPAPTKTPGHTSQRGGLQRPSTVARERVAPPHRNLVHYLTKRVDRDPIAKMCVGDYHSRAG